MPFIPTPDVINNLIRKAASLKNEQDVLMMVNPKERKRQFDERDLNEPIFTPYCELRILPTKYDYPTLEENWPDFFEEVNLEHLTQKYKPTKIKLAEEAAKKAEFEKLMNESDEENWTIYIFKLKFSTFY